MTSAATTAPLLPEQADVGFEAVDLLFEPVDALVGVDLAADVVGDDEGGDGDRGEEQEGEDGDRYRSLRHGPGFLLVCGTDGGVRHTVVAGTGTVVTAAAGMVVVVGGGPARTGPGAAGGSGPGGTPSGVAGGAAIAPPTVPAVPAVPVVPVVSDAAVEPVIAGGPPPTPPVVLVLLVGVTVPDGNDVAGGGRGVTGWGRVATSVPPTIAAATVIATTDTTTSRPRTPG